MAEGLPSSFSPTPGNFTLSQMKNRIARFVSLTGTEALAVAQESLDEAIGEYNARTWKWSLTYDDITLSAADNDYEILNAWKAPARSHLLDSSDNARLRIDYIDPANFDLRFPRRDTTTQGRPTHYTCHWQHGHGYLILSLKPDAGYVADYPTLRHWYFQRIQRPTIGGSKVNAPDEVQTGLLWLARSVMAAHYAPEKEARAYQRHERIWRECIASDNLIDFTDFDAGANRWAAL